MGLGADFRWDKYLDLTHTVIRRKLRISVIDAQNFLQYLGEQRQGKTVNGLITSETTFRSGRHEALVLMDKASHDTQEIHLSLLQGAVLSFEPPLSLKD